MSVSAAPPRSRRYSDDVDDHDNKYYYDQDSSLSHASPRRRRPRDSKHENCRDGTCEAIEKEYGGFGWGEGITLAVVGAMALFNFDKAYEKHKAKSERREREEKEHKKRREKERRHSVGGDRNRDVDGRGEGSRRESLPRDAYYHQGRDGYRPRGSSREEERARRKERYVAGDDPYQRRQSHADRYY